MQYLINSINTASAKMFKTLSRDIKQDHESIFAVTLICDEHGLNYHMLGSLLKFISMGLKIDINVVSSDFPKNKALLESIFDEYITKRLPEDSDPVALDDVITMYSDFESYKNAENKIEAKKTLFMFLLDFNDEKYSTEKAREAALENIKGCLDEISALEGDNTVLFGEVMPCSEFVPAENPDIAEREYEFYAMKAGETSLEYLPVAAENILRNYDLERLHIKVVRIPSVFGPKIEDSKFLKLDEYAKEITQSKTITLNASEFNRKFSFVYCTDALTAICRVLFKGADGNIYNVSQYRKNNYLICLELIKTLKAYGVELKIDNENVLPSFNFNFASKKLKSIGWKPQAAIKTQLMYTIFDKLGWDIAIKAMDDRDYDAKLDIIKKLELDVVKEIDRICKKHSIKYFLVGGSLLGAVRHNGFITWDDDLDIGMLREDYEKFKKVAPKELSEKYTYQSYDNEPGTHFIFDKIRIKDTYFSTKFSNMFKMENGIFVDILIYDKTSNNPLKQKKHIRNLIIWRRAINVRWVNYPRKNIHYKLTKIALPFMRRVPFDFFHGIFNHILKKYNKKKNCEYLIDGVGQNLIKGAFPAEWFDEIIDMPFEDTKLPVPAKYDEYLRHWYGPRYMELPPIAARFSGHKLSRIDLGPFIMEDYQNYNYHNNDFRGELFETTDE